MNIAIGADHRGFAHKEIIKAKNIFGGVAITWIDVGADNAQRSDYPVFVKKACDLIMQGKVHFAVLLCGSGVGMSIAANRFKNIYAALVWNEEVAQQSKEDDNANVLVIPADFVSAERSILMIEAWLKAQFKGGRYQERLSMIDGFGK